MSVLLYDEARQTTRQPPVAMSFTSVLGSGIVVVCIGPTEAVNATERDVGSAFRAGLRTDRARASRTDQCGHADH